MSAKTRFCRDALLLCLAFTVFVVGTMAFDPWLWLADYPPAIQAVVNPPSIPVGHRTVAALALLAVFVLQLLLTWRWARRGRLWGSVVAYAFGLSLAVSVWDLVIVDWLVFATWRPGFIVLPGNGVAMTPALFRALAVQPVLGRALADDDAMVGVEPVVVIGESLWRRVYGGDPDIIGSRITVSGSPVTVVGIQGAGGGILNAGCGSARRGC